MIFDAVLWNVDPEIFHLGSLSIRWYGLLFSMAFLLGYMGLSRIFKKEKKEVELLDKLTMYMLLGTIIGARLGHVLFYQPGYYFNNPLEILMTWHGGLASHGGALGILTAIYIFCRKNKTSYFWTLDRVVIMVALAGCCIRAGNLVNSEIYGVPTKSTYGFIFARDITDISSSNKYNIDVSYKIEDTLTKEGLPAKILLTFPENIDNYTAKFKIERIINYLKSEDSNFKYDDAKEISFEDGTIVIPAYAIPKHPTQIYEASAYLFVFFILAFIYFFYSPILREGILSGIFMFLVFGFRFFIEFIKETQVDAEKTMALNIGQILSIPLVIAGAVLIIYGMKKKKITD